MLTAEQLQDAENQGIITAEQRDQLIALVQGGENNDPETVDPTDGDERFRLVGGGNDVFVGIGLVLLMAGVWTGLSTLLPDNGVTQAALMAGFVWLVAEFITRRRRMKFSSLLLAIAFTGCAGWLIELFVATQFAFSVPDQPLQFLNQRDDIRLAGLLICGLLATIAVIYFVRFRVPFMAAVMAVSAIGLVVLFVADFTFDRVLAYDIKINDQENMRQALRSLLYVPLACGLLIFATGVALDIKDRKRESVMSDCAFWLHVISAPLIVHPLFVLATGQNLIFEGNEADSSATVLAIALIAVFFYVALAIDRRSLLVPSLGYFGTVGIYFLVSAASETTGIPSFAVILAVIGILIIVFGVGWQRIRALVVGTTLPHVILNKLPPVRS